MAADADAGGRIAVVGDLSAAEAQRTLDATGLVVCPGFIDIHTYSDWTLLANPRAESLVVDRSEHTGALPGKVLSR